MREEKSNGIIKHDKVQDSINTPDREAKIMNCVMNTSVILMSTIMGAFTEVMLTATGDLAAGIADAVDEESGEKVRKEIKEKLPEANEKMKQMVSDMRKELSAQFEQKREEIKPMLSNPKFDVGPEIVGRYEFGLPKLSEELADETFAKYILLLEKEDSRFVEMFKELTDWMNQLPTSPAESNKQ